MFVSTMVHPTQGECRPLGSVGFLFSTADIENANRGMSRRFKTFQILGS